MTHMQFIPGDPRIVDQLVYELKSRGIFDQFRKECIADVDTRPAYQNLRQRVENSVATFLARQVWKPDLNKNQLREKLRKHILDGNYLEQGVERIVDQVVNPKVASVFIPQVEDLVYDFFGISRKKSAPATETSNEKANENDLLPTDLEAVSPGSVKSNDDKAEVMDTDDIKGEDTKMEVDQEDKSKEEIKEDSSTAHEVPDKEKIDSIEAQLSIMNDFALNDSNSIDKISIPLPSEEIKPENIPPPEDSPPKVPNVELESIELPKELDVSTDIPLPDEIPALNKDQYFKPISVNSDDDSSSDSSLRRNMSPLTPIRNFNNENSCDAQQAFENESTDKDEEKKEPSSFRFTIESKSPENNTDAIKNEKMIESEQTALSYQFSSQVNINTFNTPLYDDSSNSNILHIDYESDANSKTNTENKVLDAENSEDSRKEKKTEEKRSSHKSSHRSRDSHRHSSSKDRRSDSKHSTSRDGSKYDRKSSSKDEHGKSKSSHKERSRDRNEKKDSRDSSKHGSSHKSSSSHRDSKSHKSSSSSQKNSSKNSDDKKSSSSHKDKSDKILEKSSKDTKDKSSKDSKSSSHKTDKNRKSSSKSKHEDKDKQKKEKKESDDHYSVSGRGNHSRRSTDRDSNDGSSSSKGSNNQSNAKSLESKKETKGTSKSDNTSTSSDSTSPSDKEHIVNEANRNMQQSKPIVRIETHLEIPISAPPRLPFVPDVTLKKPKYAANLKEAKKLMKMRKFLDEEQKRMNQEAALLLEFQANVRPSLSQVYSSIPGPELEFACITNAVKMVVGDNSQYNDEPDQITNNIEDSIHMQNLDQRNDALIEILTAAQQVDNIEERNLQIENSGNHNHVYDENRSIELEDENSSDTKARVQQPENIESINIPEPNTIVIKDDRDTDKTEQFNEQREDVIEVKNEPVNEIKEKDKTEQFNEQLENVIETMDKPVTEIKGNVSKDNINDSEDVIASNLENLERDEDKKRTEYFEVTVITEELSENEDAESKLKDVYDEIKQKILENYPDETLLEYFGEHEKYNAELERDKFSKFLKTFTDQVSVNKMYLINCDTYEENVLKEASLTFGNFEIVNYYKNGHFKMTKAKNIDKDLNINGEIILPLDKHYEEMASSRSPIFSPVKSECSFELSSDYDAKLEEMVNKTSRKEIMEIILGSSIDESPSKMPKIDYCMDSNIESDVDKPKIDCVDSKIETDTENTLKRKLPEVESTVNNRQVLTPHKIRRLSESDQISSTTEESEEASNNNVPNNVRSKYLGRARRVGLPRPRRTNLPNSPSSDKSVENYEQNTPAPQTPNGKLKMTPRIKVQRYDTSDLYKPKLHYLSRRNNIS